MKKWKDLQTAVNEYGLEALLVQTRSNVFYASGFDADPHERLIGVVIPAHGVPSVICPAMEKNQIHHVFPEAGIFTYEDGDDPWALTAKACGSIKKLGLESSISWGRLTALTDALPDTAFTEADELILSLRQRKTPEELAVLREAAAFADQGVEEGVRLLRTGITEMEVIAGIEHYLKKQGVREMSFQPMVLFGGGAGDPHGVPGTRELKPGDNVLMDLGVKWKGYCSDITRTVFYGHVEEKQEQIYQTVLAAQLKAVETASDASVCGEIDTAARQVINGAGYGSFFPHRIGHGMGIDVHEAPSMDASSQVPLEPGLVFTIEPGIYIPDEIGIRIEDDLVIKGGGAEVLTAYPKELQVVPVR
ncbi:M24 family metallopeptidase [Alkalicoccus urumqiensis]|uniref:Peptidase M24 family protein n=1 Tax=Alkalicoccus urumqiensis TaxID=1548213 RepID=A0A2P6MD81_ALKUR|nr:Xaa-Pro peptidase family protein [Alkalicoccus urumqiensis]PRO64234.1 peptidase M24 family protein [Alkalicoccus urumqiensis]